MKIIAVLLGLVGTSLWYLSQQPAREEWSIHLKEINQSLPAPSWMICLGLAAVFFLMSFRKSKTTIAADQPENTQKTPTSPQKSVSEPNVVHSTNDDWRAKIQTSAQTVSFPRGGSIIIDAQKDIPLTLRLPHKTHQAYKESIDIFCQWLVTQPTPKRISVRFDSGVTEQEQNLVRSVLRKHYHINDHIIQQTAHGVDVLFHHPAREWGSKFNLFKEFLQ